LKALATASWCFTFLKCQFSIQSSGLDPNYKLHHICMFMGKFEMDVSNCLIHNLT